MGKRYHCEYCDKTMVSTPAIVKTHNKGVAHQKIVQEHYQQFKDPETILAEESQKKPCSRFARGECQFGSICRFSHYTQEQIQQLKNYVTSKHQTVKDHMQPSFQDLYMKLQTEKSAKPSKSDNNTIMVDKNGLTHVFPWTYNEQIESYGNIPPSVRKFVCLQDVKTKVYLMDPKLLQSMLPTYNSSEETSSLIESKETGEVINKADYSDDYDRKYEEYYESDEEKPILRTKYVKVNVHEGAHQLHSIKAKSEKVHSQHQKRLAELMAYLEKHMISTLYFYQEMQRILEQRKVKDDLRKMVTFLEHEPGIKAKVLACYHKYREESAKQKDVWRHPTNDLVIDYVHDY